MFETGKNIEEIAESIMTGFEIEITDEGNVGFVCDCSKEKFEKGLVTLGKKEITAILLEDEKAEVCCHFCNTKYQFNKEDLQNILGSM